MFKSISRLDSFGVFHRFRQDPSLGFRKKNLIYGRNYSGKTTLSRAFRCLEKQQKHPDFTSATVEFELDDGTRCTPVIPLNGSILRVFNGDFITENLRFGGGDAAPILVLGADDIEKEQQLQAKQAALRTEIDKKAQHENESKTLEEQTSRELTKAAKATKDILQRPDYDRRHLEKALRTCAQDPDQHILNDTDYQVELAKYRSTDKLPNLPPMAAPSSIRELEEKGRQLLARVVQSKETRIAELLEGGEIERWIREGLLFHADKTTCSFCGHSIPHERIALLNLHFSKEYEDLLRDLDGLQSEATTRESSTLQLPHGQQFYSEIRDAFAQALSKLEEVLHRRRDACATLIARLTEKRAQVSQSLVLETLDYSDEMLRDALANINALIAQHNTRTRDFESTRDEAFGKLERHRAASFAHEYKYIEMKGRAAASSSEATGCESRIAALRREIASLEKEASDVAKGAEILNQHLGAYFGSSHISILVTPGKRFQISRDNRVATNLSEGEKTAIAFAYFVALVEDGRTPLANTIVFIDDPISSLDSNHLFNTYAMIKTRFAACKQIFLSTHSFEFFALLRDWCKDEEDRRSPPSMTKWSVFLLERSDVGSTSLKQIPDPLWRFNSEYVYLFSLLYEFDKSVNPNLHQQLSLPNSTRRFLESFAGIMLPRSTGLKEKMRDIFPQEVSRERVWRFINYYSHNRSITAATNFPDTSECLGVVRICLESVRLWDQRHFDELVRSVT